MKIKKASTTVLVIAAVAVLTVFAFRVRTAASADSVAVLKTTGMTCGSCSAKIKKTLESLPGVAAAEVDINGGWVVVGYDKKMVTPEKLAAQVKETGFPSMVTEVTTPEQFRKVTGRSVGQSDQGPGCCGGKGGCGANK